MIVAVILLIVQCFALLTLSAPQKDASEDDVQVTHISTVKHVIQKREHTLAVDQTLKSTSSNTSLSASFSKKTSTTQTLHSIISNTITLKTHLSTSQVQSVTSSGTFSPRTHGTVIPSLESNGHISTQPFNINIIRTISGAFPLVTTGSNVISSIKTGGTSAAASNNIFVALSNARPFNNIDVKPVHPVPRLGINRIKPIQTNKFYANFFLNSRQAPTWTHPYSVSWLNGLGSFYNWGLAVIHVERSQVAYGPGSPAAFFLNPLGIYSLILSADGLQSRTALTLDSLEAFSVNVNLAPTLNHTAMVTFPLVQGMAFVTAKYRNAQPIISSTVTFFNLTFGGNVTGSASTVRYTVLLNDMHTWLIYITPNAGQPMPILTLVNSTSILSSTTFSGIIQVAKNPSGDNGQRLLDRSAGVYPTSAFVSGSINGAVGSYTLSWQKGGLLTRKLLMYALPHHVDSFSSPTRSGVVENWLHLDTTTKGIATAVYGDAWTMVENLPSDMDFAPWSPTSGRRTIVPKAARVLINATATSELAEDMNAQTNLNSMYFAGKGLAKFASIVWAANAMGNNSALASAGLLKLQAAFSRFVNNTQIFPLVYENCWGGVVSSATYVTGDYGQDFGNAYYNDHHFHYGYFVYTAAVIAYLDPTWLKKGTNKAWVNMLVRDYANPSTNDPYFPFSRMFDWYHGHSWAHGLFESYDGKDQESSSEDALASYALKMWGYAIGDPNMEARGNLMLAIQARSFSNYYLYTDSNNVEPPTFIGNKVAGIIFENKIDHTTYFGNNISFIEGIHMLPLNPSSAFTRSVKFVTQEWNTYFSNNRSAAVAPGGWRGILMANLALIDPKASYQFFAGETTDGWQDTFLDGGASRTWYLAFAAGLGGADKD